MGVFKWLIVTSWSSVYNLVLGQDVSCSKRFLFKTFLVSGDAGAVGELAALCVKENENVLHLDSRAYVNEMNPETIRNRRLSHNNAIHGRTELKHIGNG